MGTYQKYSTLSLLQALAFILLGLPLLADHSATTYPDDDSDLSIDGPHIFYKDGKATVKSIALKNGAYELLLNEYNSRSEVPPLFCKIDTELSFQIDLKKEIAPMPAEVPQPSKLFAISDIEGNFHAFAKTLIGNDVVDKNLNWIYGDGHLVLVGDFFDRGLNVTACLWLIYQLENQAAENGGMVHFVLGNHEEMNLSGDHRYVREKYMKVAEKMNCSYGELYSQHTELGRWLRSKNMIVKVGETLFVHGGLSPQMANSNITIDRINKICRAHIGKKAEVLQSKGGNVSAVFAKTGPFWYRGFFNKLSTEDIRTILSQFGVKQVVVGHTVVDDVSTLHDGMVYAIDVKHSEKIQNAQYNAMVIEDDTFYKVNCFGKRELINAVRKSADDGSAIILKAIKDKNLEVVEAFLKEGYKVNDYYSGKKFQLLHFAIEFGDQNIVNYLLDAGADPDLFQEGKSALMQAIKHRNTSAVASLLSRSTNVNLANHRRQTALFYAAKYGNEDIVKALLDAGADTEAIDQAGLSPFQYAVKNKNIEVAKYLKSLERK